MSSGEQLYETFEKPSWAPPAKVFAPVWAVLYTIIAISFIYLIYQGTQGNVSWMIFVPMALNLLFNFLYYPLQFWLKSTWLATIDILLVLGTLIWLLVAIWIENPEYAWTGYVNIPYLGWVLFATILQLNIFWRKYLKK